MIATAILATALSMELPDGIFSDGFDATAPIGCTTTINPDGVIRTRLATSAVGYGAQQITRPHIILTEWDNVYGYNGLEIGQPVPWPGVTGSAPTFQSFRMDSYIALHFATPFAPEPGFASTFKIPTAIGSPPVTIAISRACGDFSQWLPSPRCVATSPANDQPILYYHFGQGACELQPATDYYLNIMYPDTLDRTRCTSLGLSCHLAAWR